MASLSRPILLLLSLIAGCGGAQEAVAPPISAAGGATTVGTQSQAPPAPITSLRRSDVRAAIGRGLGAFLQNVAVEDWPVMRDGKFYGFKIKAINPEWGIDLRPGDVVTRVNGIVPERPDDADNALRSLEKAKSLKVEYERDGKPRTLELPIVD